MLLIGCLFTFADEVEIKYTVLTNKTVFLRMTIDDEHTRVKVSVGERFALPNEQRKRYRLKRVFNENSKPFIEIEDMVTKEVFRVDRFSGFKLRINFL